MEDFPSGPVALGLALAMVVGAYALVIGLANDVSQPMVPQPPAAVISQVGEAK